MSGEDQKTEAAAWFEALRNRICAALEAITEHVCPGRWSDARLPTDGELAATIVLKMPIEQASAKIRTGPPKDVDDDLSLRVWAGLLPLRSGYGEPIPDPKLRSGVTLPTYLREV